MHEERDAISGWDKAKTVGNIVGAVLTPLAVVWVGSILSSSVRNREVDAKMVEISVGVLSAEPNEHSRGLRGWAVRVLEKCSPVPLTEAVRDSLIEKRLDLGGGGGSRTWGGPGSSKPDTTRSPAERAGDAWGKWLHNPRFK